MSHFALAESSMPTRDVLEPLFALARNDEDDANLDSACRQLLFELAPGRMTNLKIAVIGNDKACMAHLFRGGELEHSTLPVHRDRAFALLDMLVLPTWGMPNFFDTREEIAGASSTEAILRSLFAYFARPEQTYPHPAVSVFDGVVHVRPLTSLKYQVVSASIGEGGFGKVYKCKRADDERPVPMLFAMKKVDCLQVAQDQDKCGNFDAATFQAKLEREVESLRSLHHPHIVAFVDALAVEPSNGTPEQRPHEFAGASIYIIMELVGQEGFGDDPVVISGELFGLIGSSDFSDEDMKVAMAQIGRALLYSHHCNILHRDVKPENVFLTKTRSGAICAKLLDFGLSKTVGCTPSTSGIFSFVGTTHYRAPEIGKGPYTAKIDLYSFGITLCCVFGRTMPVRNSFHAIDFRYVAEQHGAKTSFRQDTSHWRSVFNRPGVTFSLQDLCLQGCHAEPTRRLTMEQAMQHPFWGDLAMSADEIEASRAMASGAFVHLSAGGAPFELMDLGFNEEGEDYAHVNEMEGGEKENMGVDQDV